MINKEKLLFFLNIKKKKDLDQLNLILNVLGSPDKESLEFIRNLKVKKF